MSGKFVGFSEDEIKKVKTGGNINVPVLLNRSYKRAVRNKTRSYNSTKLSPNMSVIKNEISEEAKLSPKIDNGPTKIEDVPLVNEHSNIPSEEEKVKEFPKPIDIETFADERKKMEEANKRRKELLAKAIADRAKKTNAEARKLEAVQKELNELDDSLSNDVHILRNEIENASFAFLKCQKRFEILETEYKSVKKQLEQKREMKEMLTQHLCLIIEQTELRKAEKLEQLMREFNLEDSPNES